MIENIDIEILNNFINLIIVDVATKYFIKIKEEKLKSPKLIEDYLSKSIYFIINLKLIILVSNYFNKHLKLGVFY